MTNWFGYDKNRKLFNEQNNNWNECKDKLESLSMEVNKTIIDLPKNLEYIQAKTASASLGDGKAVIESRYIGFFLGNNIIKVRVNEKTNNISIEVDKR